MPYNVLMVTLNLTRSPRLDMSRNSLWHMDAGFSDCVFVVVVTQGPLRRLTLRGDLYVGGHVKYNSTALRLLSKRKHRLHGIVGCIRKLQINEKVYDMSRGAFIGDALQHVNIGTFSFWKRGVDFCPPSLWIRSMPFFYICELSFNRDFARCWRAFDMSNKYYLLTNLLTSYTRQVSHSYNVTTFKRYNVNVLLLRSAFIVCCISLAALIRRMPTFPTILILNNYGQITVVLWPCESFLHLQIFFAHWRGKKSHAKYISLSVARKICTFQIFGAHAWLRTADKRVGK